MSTQDIILGLHLTTLGLVALTLFQADRHALNWVRGKEPVLSGKDLRKVHKRTWLGLSLMIATGLLLFWPRREFLLAHPPFYIKMGFVIALVINGLVIGRLQKVAAEKTFASLSAKEKMPLFISGAVSTLSWAGAALVAFFLIPD